jgi:hypothetical protein
MSFQPGDNLRHPPAVIASLHDFHAVVHQLIAERPGIKDRPRAGYLRDSRAVRARAGNLDPALVEGIDGRAIKIRHRLKVPTLLSADASC